MTTFNEHESYQETLMYDTTAFLHYLNSIFSIITIILIFLIAQDIIKKIKPKSIRVMEKDQIFRTKASNTWKLWQKQTGQHLKWRFCGLVVCSALIALCIKTTSTNGQLKSFDPYEILNIHIDATNTQIKKAYRKLALETHPDRKKDGSTSSKFILVSKAYKCLTNTKTRENCMKFGNPDGEIYKKFGIGLPTFMLKNRYENYVAFALLTILLVIIPTIFFKWEAKLNHKKSINEHMIESNEVAYLLMTPKLNNLDCCLILGCMKELQNVFIDHNVLISDQYEQFVRKIVQQSNLDQQELRRISQHKLYRCYKVYQFMTNKTHQIELASKIPQLCKDLIEFASNFGKRSLQGYLLAQNSDLTVKWYGLAPCKKSILFSRNLISQTNQTFINQLFSQQQLTEEQRQAITNLQDQSIVQLVSSQEQKNKLVKKFKHQKQQKLKKYIDHLPSITLSYKIKCGQSQVAQVTVGDVVLIEINAFRNNETFGHVVNINFPILAKQEFMLTISSNANLLSSFFFNFQQKQSITHTLELKKLRPGLLKINVSIYSLSYLNYDITEIKTIEVFEKLKKQRVIFNEEDLKIEKMKKNFFEALIDLNMNRQSDQQFTDSQQDEQQQRERIGKKQKIGQKKVNQSESDNSERKTGDSN